MCILYNELIQMHRFEDSLLPWHNLRFVIQMYNRVHSDPDT